jgi:adenylyltransferase/sulfurtransferase
MPLANGFSNIKIPLALLKDNIGLIKSDTIVTFCQTGQRSLQAAKILSGIFGKSKTIYSLRGGLAGLKKLKEGI